MLIRQASPIDIPSICRLQQQWLEEGNVYGLVPDSAPQIAAALGPYFLVAEVEGEVVGFISPNVEGLSAG